jgi:hypothetical protein
MDVLVAFFHEDGTFVNVVGSYKKDPGRDPAITPGHSRQFL